MENMLKRIRMFAGDVHAIRYSIFGLLFSFVGLVIGIKRKFFFNLSFLAFRNVMAKISVEVNLPSLLLTHWEARDFSKKAFKYKKSKLLYLRSKKNKKSIINPF